MCGEQIALDVAVDRFLADIELVGIVFNDVVRRLTVKEQGADKLIQSAEFILRDVDTGTGFREGLPVSLMSLLVMIKAFAQCTLALISARITNIRRRIETQANLLLEIRAQGVAEFAVGAFPVAIGLVRAKLAFDATLAKQATVAVAPISTLEAIKGAGADLA